MKDCILTTTQNTFSNCLNIDSLPKTCIPRIRTCFIDIDLVFLNVFPDGEIFATVSETPTFVDKHPDDRP